MRRPTVAIVGAGFSGLLTALHLLADPYGPIVRLIERRGVFGRGVAYASAHPEHRLNVRAANMSAFPDDPDHFLRWLSSCPGEPAGEGFVTRRTYGEYLQGLLRRAAGQGGRRLLLEADEAVDLAPDGEGWIVALSLGRTFAADAVILAVGPQPSAPPEGASPQVLASARYVADPWSLAPEADLGERVLLLGSGLTMIDVALAQAAPGRRFIALSRRGLAPRPHASRYVAPGLATSPHGSPPALLRRFRREAAAGDWRERLDGWRPHVRTIWSAWSDAQRRQALRHLAPWWDVHRHRMAPAVGRDFERLRAAGTLALHAGRLRSMALEADRLHVTWTPRGEPGATDLRVDAAINCTGPGGDLAQGGGPLLARLLARGLIQPDPFGLGAQVDHQARPIGLDARPHPRLFAVGPLTRGAFLEITAVPDIRIQARDVAGWVCASLDGQIGGSSRAQSARRQSAAARKR